MLDAQLPVLAVAVHCHWHADHSKIVPRLTDCTSDEKKVKFSRTGYRALGPELIPVYRQSARR